MLGGERRLRDQLCVGDHGLGRRSNGASTGAGIAADWTKIVPPVAASDVERDGGAFVINHLHFFPINSIAARCSGLSAPRRFPPPPGVGGAAFASVSSSVGRPRSFRLEVSLHFAGRRDQDNRAFQFALVFLQIVRRLGVEIDDRAAHGAVSARRPGLGVGDKRDEIGLDDVGREAFQRPSATERPQASRLAFCSPHSVSLPLAHSLALLY